MNHSIEPGKRHIAALTGVGAEADRTSADDLEGRVVLITGAARRLGAAMARGFHAEGADIGIHFYRSRQDAEQLMTELNQTRAGSAVAVGADLLDTASLAELVTRIQAAFGRLDILINNASSFYPTPLGGVSASQWEDLMGTNLRAPFFLAQAAAPALRAGAGLILNMIDIHAQRPLPDHLIYSSAKAGLAMLTRALARELGPEIRVNGIAPGPILWPDAGMDESLKAEIVSKTLLKRSGCPQDIVRAALFFAKNAPYVTGQILAVDGGRSVGW
nr:pteridine reductase [Steroidobacter denitrificans]